MLKTARPRKGILLTASLNGAYLNIGAYVFLFYNFSSRVIFLFRVKEKNKKRFRLWLVEHIPFICLGGSGPVLRVATRM